MADQNREMDEQNVPKEQGEYTPSVATEFLRETIKQKPVNKKKLFRRTLTTVIMAVVFGMVACLTFLILQPVINNWLNPEEEAELIQFPEEVVEVEPEEFYVDDIQMIEEELEDVNETTAHDSEIQAQKLLENIKLGTSDYENLYAGLRDLAKDLERSIVTVTGVTSDVDWFNNKYNNEKQASGVVVADNGRALLIVVKDMGFDEAERVQVGFCDGTEIQAEYLGKDPYTGFAVISARFARMTPETKDVVAPMKLGTSNGVAMRGMPVIALGSPTGTTSSVKYGIITSEGVRLNLVDSDYKVLNTDIYGATGATGVLVNLKGYLVGVIDNSYNSTDTKNQISAVGISELKNVIEKISNQETRVYMGIHGQEVPYAVQRELNVPSGTYVSGVEMNSPAMAAGIQTGDIIAAVDGTDIANFRELLSLLNEASPNQTLTLKVMRQTVEEYAEITLEITLGSMER